MALGMASARQRTSIVWVTMLTVPPRLTPGRLVGVPDPDRDVDADRRTLAKPHEIHMQRQVADGVELKVTGNDAVLHAVDLDVVNGGEKVSGIDALAQVAVVERDRQRRLAVAVDDSGYAAHATLGPGGPLAGPRTRRRFDEIDGRHDVSSSSTACMQERAAAASRGAGAAVAGL